MVSEKPSTSQQEQKGEVCDWAETFSRGTLIFWVIHSFHWNLTAFLGAQPSSFHVLGNIIKPQL